MGDIWNMVQKDLVETQGSALSSAGYDLGFPFDFYVRRAKAEVQVSSCIQVPIFAELYCLTSRFDQDQNPYTAYQASTSAQGFHGTAGALGGHQNPSANAYGATPYWFRILCQCFDIKCLSKFTLLPGRVKRFTKSINKMVHVTPRFATMESMKGTQYLLFHFKGGPTNDTATKTDISSLYGDVDIISQVTYEYQRQANPGYFRDYENNFQSPSAPMVIIDNTRPASNIIDVA